MGDVYAKTNACPLIINGMNDMAFVLWKSIFAGLNYTRGTHDA